jgi:DNA-binding CsgD family transcriptional regulator/tetratricopeptide (TPR) repeat protein
LLQLADGGPRDGGREASIAVLRAQLRLSSAPTKRRLEALLDAAINLAASDAGAAREVLLQVLAWAMFDERFAGAPMLPRIAAAVTDAPSPAEPRPLDLLLDALGSQVRNGPGAMAEVRDAVDAFCRAGALDARDMRWLWLVCSMASTLWDDRTWETLSDSQLRALRHAGLLTALPAALNYRAVAHILGGELADAAAVIEEAYAIGSATGAQVVNYAELILCAFRGNEARILELREAGLQDGSGRVLTSVEYARAVLYNGLGQYDRAVEAALEVSRRDEPAFRSTAPPELIEAAVRAGRAELARPAFEQLCARARLAGTDWALATELRARAVMEDGTDVEELYRGSIERVSRCRLPIHLARTRQGRRSDARSQLRTAHELLVSVGAHPFAARAAGELRATGERPRKRTPSTADELTAQELQIARLVAAGATSKEVAAELFLSPRTIDAHLRSIFRKLGITSRRQLRNMPFGGPQRISGGSGSSEQTGA